MAEQQGQEKTEQPTEKKLQESREKGQVAKSTEISSFTVFSSGLLLLFLTKGYLGGQLSELSVEIFKSLSVLELNKNLIQIYAYKGFIFFLLTLAPFFAGVIFFALGANLLQVGIKLSPKALRPKFDKLNPLKGIKKIFFSSRSIVEVLKSVLKLVIVGLFSYLTISSFITNSTTLLDQSISEIADYMSETAISFLWKIMIVYAVLAAADFIFQKFKFKKEMMMTKQDVKEEHKQSDGDPYIKGKIKSKQFEMSRNRMIMEVGKADVVITNPTHYAVALKYDALKSSAPMIIAKGIDKSALKIKEIAKEKNIPIYEDKPLAQALYKTCSIGDEIPEKLFQAVAKILAFVYQMKKTKKSIV